MKLSIITTFYNDDKYILDAIESVNRQMFNMDYEYILVDDCSSDRSRDIVLEYIDKRVVDKDRWRLVTMDSNSGCGAARARGCREATGDYLMFLDADDYYINDDFCCRAVLDIEKYNADIVDYGYLLDRDIMVPYTVGEVIVYNGEQALFNMFANNSVKFQVWSKIIRKRIVDKVPYDETREYEDVRTMPIWCAVSEKVVCMPNVEVMYRENVNSIIRKDMHKTRLGTQRAFLYLCKVFEVVDSLTNLIYKRAMIDFNDVENEYKDKDKDDYYNEMMDMKSQMEAFITKS